MPCISPAKATQPKGVCRRCIARHGDAAHTYDEVKGKHCPMCEAKVLTLYTRSAAAPSHGTLLKDDLKEDLLPSATVEARTDSATPLGLSVETKHNGRWQTFHDTCNDSCHFLEYEDVDEINAAADELVYSIDLMLDSGAADHVINNIELPQHPLTQPTRQRNFVTASGDRIPGKGEMHVEMEPDGSPLTVCSTFQVTDVSRALYSVAKICDAGCEAHFTSKEAVISKDGKDLFRFERSNGGLYSKRMTVRSPAAKGASTSTAEASKPQPEAPGFTRRGRR